MIPDELFGSGIKAKMRVIGAILLGIFLACGLGKFKIISFFFFFLTEPNFQNVKCAEKTSQPGKVYKCERIKMKR